MGFNLSWAVGPLTAANWENLSKRLGLSQERLEEVIRAKDNLTEGYLHLPLEESPDLKGGLAPYYYDWLAHPEFDEYWKKVCIAESHSEIEVPSLNWGGWYDVFLGGTIDNYVRMRHKGATEAARKGQRLLIGPWDTRQRASERRGGVSLRDAGGVDGAGPAGNHSAVLRPLAEGGGQRGGGGEAGADFRDGGECVAVGG